MGSIRRTRGRSRNGCKQCREDRKKCDETRPSCGRCSHRRVECEFDRPLGIRIGNRRRSNLTSTTTPSDTTTPTVSLATVAEPISSAGPSTSGFQERRTSIVTQYTADSSPLTETSPLQIFGVPNSSLAHSRADADWGAMHPMSASQDPSGDGLAALTAGESDPLHDLLKDLFGTGLPDPSLWASPLSFNHMGAVPQHAETGYIDPTLHLAEMQAASLSPSTSAPSRSVAPDDVRQRFNAPGTDPRTALRDTLSADVLATLSDTDVRLFYHYIDVQAPISIACEPEDNPLAAHWIPVALSSALTGGNEDNPAFHALKACAATHRANLMESTGQGDPRPFRAIAQTTRKTAYSLLAVYIRDLARQSPLIREQFAGALAILVSLAVVDGNAQLLHRLLHTYFQVLKAIDLKSLSSAEIFFISATSLYQTWLNFSLVVVLGQPCTPLLCEALPKSTRFPTYGLESIFCVPMRVSVDHLRVYRMMGEYSTAVETNDAGKLMDIELEAEDLATALGRELSNDLAHWTALEDPTPRDRRLATTMVMHHAALRVLLLQAIFKHPNADYRVRDCVHAGLQVLDTVKWGTETGLLIPLTVLSTAALEDERQEFKSFMRRLCWKGSAGPRAAMEMLQTIMDDPKQDWRDVLAKVGAPILV